MKIHFYILIAILFIFNSCQSESISKEYVAFSTDSDSTMYYYNLGWQQIMDYGDYSAAEVSYRKALNFDGDFLVGKSVLARLTTDLEERLALFEELENKKHTIIGDERLILDVYIALTKYTNLRDQKSPHAKDALQEAFKLSEQNFGKIVHQYPKEIYLKSEYIEVIHALHGARASLDAIEILTTDVQKLNPFILGYKAILTVEENLDNHKEAVRYAYQLSDILKNKKVARPDAILADIYFKIGDLESAKIHADKANRIDPKNLDASRLKVKIDKALGI